MLAAGICLASSTLAQTEETRTLEVSGGASVNYTLRTHPAGAHLARPGAELAPTSALDAAKLLNLHLSAGDILEAAVLSNAPRRRFEVLRDYRESVGADEFKKVFSQYLSPQNRLIAEIAIDRHRLLIWDLKEGATRIAGQYFIEIEGRYFIDDVPNDTRTSLRWVLEAYRSGKQPR
jgi:predicted metal-dependent phosphoesterase TrpH